MIILPTPYTVGLSDGYPLLYIVRINLGGTTPVFLCSQNGMSLTYGSVAVPSENLFTEYLAAEIDGEEVSGIDEIDYQINPQQGGGIGGVNEARLQMLNHQRFSDFMAQFNVDGSDLELWEGFMPPSLTVAIDTDMIRRFHGIAQDATPYDNVKFTLPCVDRRCIDTRLLPQRVIQFTTFPKAPPASIGKTIPVVLGDFTAPLIPGNESSIDGVPCIQVDQYSMAFAVADHALSDLAPNALYRDENGLTGIIQPNP